MNGGRYDAIARHPKFQELVRRRSRFAITLSIAMLVLYFGFILTIAFAPAVLAMPMGGVTTVGIPVGVGVIVAAFVLTGIYVRKANTTFDQLNQQILQEMR